MQNANQHVIKSTLEKAQNNFNFTYCEIKFLKRHSEDISVKFHLQVITIYIEFTCDITVKAFHVKFK